MAIVKKNFSFAVQSTITCHAAPSAMHPITSGPVVLQSWSQSGKGVAVTSDSAVSNKSMPITTPSALPTPVDMQKPKFVLYGGTLFEGTCNTSLAKNPPVCQKKPPRKILVEATATVV